MKSSKPTLVIGASTDSSKYAYRAIKRLRGSGHPVIAFGPRPGLIDDVSIESSWNDNWDIDTVTLYINPTRQPAYEQKIIDLKPKRVIFNPGTENSSFMRELRENGISAEMGCTLVMLATDQY